MKFNEIEGVVFFYNRICLVMLGVVVFCGVWCGGVRCGVVSCGVVWCGVVWCGVVWAGELAAGVGVVGYPYLVLHTAS